MVLQADAPLFSETVLVQIAGRVGRDKDYPSGEVVFTYQEKGILFFTHLMRYFFVLSSIFCFGKRSLTNVISGNKCR